MRQDTTSASPCPPPTACLPILRPCQKVEIERECVKHASSTSTTKIRQLTRGTRDGKNASSTGTPKVSDKNKWIDAALKSNEPN